MQVNCLNCGKKIRVTGQECICRYCGYDNRWAQGYINFVNKEIPENNGHEKKEKTAEFIMSKKAKGILLLIVIIVAAVVHLIGALVFLLAKRGQDKVVEGGEILKEQLFADSTGVFLFDDYEVMELKAAEIVDWQYGGLPDGYQLIRIPYSLERANHSDTSDIYLQVGDSYIENVPSYTLCNFAPEEYVNLLLENAMLYMVPEEYQSGKLCVYVKDEIKDEKEKYIEKYAVPIVWE